MGWKGFMRGIVAEARRQEREARRAQREMERIERARQSRARDLVAAVRRQEREAVQEEKRLLQQAREAEKLGEQARAKNDVELYVNYVARLKSIHKECWLPWTWQQIASSQPPQPPSYQGAAEGAARAALAAYSPSFTERITGGEATKRSQLSAQIERARQHDQVSYQQALDSHRLEHARWEWFRNVAGGVLAGEPLAYRAVLEHLAPFDELGDLGTEIEVEPSASWCVQASVVVKDAEIVPDEVLSLKANGTLASKKMPKAQYWELYQDFVCSSALRVARELFALLPIDIALVHVQTLVLNTASGHEERQPILSVGFARTTVDRLNLDSIDPSDSMKNFKHQMKFSKAAGFRPVEPLVPAEFAPASG